MATIIIDSKTDVRLYIGNKSIGRIKKGTNEYEVENKEFKIYAKLAWCKSQEIVINAVDNDIQTYTLKSCINEPLIGGALMFCVGLYVVTQILFFAILFFIILLYPLYYLLLKQDEYLDLK